MDEIKREEKIFSSIDIWLNYINQMKKPKNDIESTRDHYRCISLFINKIDLSFRNLIAVPATITLLIGSYLIKFKSKYSTCNRIKCDAVKFIVDKKNVSSSQKLGLPKELVEDFPIIETYIQSNGKTLFFSGTLDRKTIMFWLRYVRAYPFSFYMNLSILAHLNAIDKIIHMFQLKAIITTEAENDFTTSCLSEYCETLGIEYIGIMHGENFVNPLHAYVRFSRFYVWDEYYIRQYEKTGSSPEFFRVYTPERFQLTIENVSQRKYYITYYLQGQNKAQLKKIYETLMVFVDKGFRCKIRMHPRATDKKLFFGIFSGSLIDIEDYHVVTIGQSYSNTEYIVSMYSTVLSEAYQNDLQAVIDDVTDINLYRNLEKMMYINLKRINLRLSFLLNGMDDKR